MLRSTESRSGGAPNGVDSCSVSSPSETHEAMFRPPTNNRSHVGKYGTHTISFSDDTHMCTCVHTVTNEKEGERTLQWCDQDGILHASEEPLEQLNARYTDVSFAGRPGQCDVSDKRGDASSRIGVRGTLCRAPD